MKLKAIAQTVSLSALAMAILAGRLHRRQQSQLELRNFYFNRIFVMTLLPKARQKRAQGFLFRYESGLPKAL